MLINALPAYSSFSKKKTEIANDNHIVYHHFPRFSPWKPGHASKIPPLNIGPPAWSPTMWRTGHRRQRGTAQVAVPSSPVSWMQLIPAAPARSIDEFGMFSQHVWVLFRGGRCFRSLFFCPGSSLKSRSPRIVQLLEDPFFWRLLQFLHQLHSICFWDGPRLVAELFQDTGAPPCSSCMANSTINGPFSVI